MEFRDRRMTRQTVLTALTFIVGAVTLFAAANAAGTIFDGKFELGPGADESGLTNILADGSTGTGPDWSAKNAAGDGLFDTAGLVVGTTPPSRVGDVLGGRAAFINDDISAGGAVDRSVYSGGPGDKNSDIVEDWTWATSSVPVKDDVGNSYAYLKNVTAPDGSTHRLLFVGGERLAANGDSHIDIEFFQASVTLDRNTACPDGKCKFVGSNTDGDLLVNMDFTNGGAFGTLTVRRRNSSANSDYDLVDSLKGEGCNTAKDICGFNNGGTIASGGWTTYESHGSPTTTLVTNAFTEFGLDVTALGFGNECFATVQVKTRSSQSFTATLKDFTLQRFQDCNASVATQLHDGVTVGASHTADDIQIGADCPTGSGANCGRGTINVGDTIHDKAIVTGIPTVTPTGTVTFLRFASADCSGPSQSSTKPLTPIGAGLAAAESDSFTATAGGNVSFKATYSGDGSYTNPTPPSPCESLTINFLRSKVITDIRRSTDNVDVLNTAITTATSVYDEATVYGLTPAGTFVAGTGPDPRGTVTFTRYLTANCSGTGVSETITIVADGSSDKVARVRSSSFTPSTATNAAAGVFVCYKATYNGDPLDANRVYLPSDASTIEPLCAFDPVAMPNP